MNSWVSIILPVAELVFGVIALLITMAKVQGIGPQAIRCTALILALTGGLFVVVLLAQSQVAVTFTESCMQENERANGTAHVGLGILFGILLPKRDWLPVQFLSDDRRHY
jgi:hypothetical protein